MEIKKKLKEKSITQYHWSPPGLSLKSIFYNSDDFSHTLITEPHATQEYTVNKILNNPMHFLHIKNCVAVTVTV